MLFGNTCLASCVFICNLLVLASGVAVVVIGILSSQSKVHVAGVVLGKQFVVSFIVFGSILIMLAILGLVGLYRLSKRMLFVFCTGLGVLAVGQASVALSSLTSPSELSTTTVTAMRNSMDFYSDSKRADIKLFWDRLQTIFQCCGLVSARNWLFVNNSSGDPPESCGKTDADERPGCVQKLNEEMTKIKSFVSIVLTSIIIVEMLAVLFSAHIVLCADMSRSPAAKSCSLE